jgi:hypothetical protein
VGEDADRQSGWYAVGGALTAAGCALFPLGLAITPRSQTLQFLGLIAFVAGLAIIICAMIGRRPANKKTTFGFPRSQVVTISVSLLVISAGGFVIFGQGHPPSQPASGRPVTIDSVMYETAQGASTAAFPQVLNSQQVTPMNQSSFPSFMAHVTAIGGAVISDAAIQIVLTGNADATSVISGIGVSKSCTAPLAGTLLYAPGAAVDTNVEIGFNLDARFPTAQNYLVTKLSGNFFTEHTISLRRGETETLLVHAITARQYCQFTFQLIVDSAGKQVTEVINDHGRPFGVTALAQLPKYRAFYVGGVADPSPNDHGDWTRSSLNDLRKTL